MKISFLNTAENERNTIEDSLADHELAFFDGSVEDNLEGLKDTEVLSLFIDTPLTKENIEQMPDLKLVATRSTGFDHIDTVFANDRGIQICNVPVYGERTVAEFAFSLIISLSRNAHLAYDRLREEGETDVKDYEGFDLVGKTLGIVGTGHIGKNVARIGRGFGMKVLLCDIQPDQDFAKEVDGEYMDLEDLVASSDIVSIHVPYMKETHHLIGKEILGKFKKGSYLINTSRGGVVDTEALIEVLNDGVIAGAGLDVVEGEEDMQDELSLLLDGQNDIEKFRDALAAHQLIDMENVVVTPHIAFNTKEAKREILDTTLGNISGFAEGEVKNTVG